MNKLIFKNAGCKETTVLALISSKLSDNAWDESAGNSFFAGELKDPSTLAGLLLYVLDD